jgi:hypothetical protein
VLTTELTAPETEQPLIPRQRRSGERARPVVAVSDVRALRALALLLILAHQVLPYDTAAAAGPTVFALTLAFLRRSPSCERTERLARHGGRGHATRRLKVSPMAGILAWAALPAVVAAGTAPLPEAAGGAVALVGALTVHFGSRLAPAGWFAAPFAARLTQYLGRLVFPAVGWMALLVGGPALVDRGLPSSLRAGLALASLLPAMLTMRQFDIWSRNRGALRPGGSYVIATTASLSLGGLMLAPAGLPAPTGAAAEFVSAVRTAPLPAAAPASGAAALPGGTHCWSPAPQFDGASCTFGETTSNVSVALVGGAHAAQWLPALELLAAGKHWRITAFLAQGCPVPSPTVACKDWLRRTTAAIGSGNYNLVLLSDASPAADDPYRAMTDALRKAGKKVLSGTDAAALSAAG